MLTTALTAVSKVNLVLKRFTTQINNFPHPFYVMITLKCYILVGKEDQINLSHICSAPSLTISSFSWKFCFHTNLICLVTQAMHPSLNAWFKTIVISCDRSTQFLLQRYIINADISFQVLPHWWIFGQDFYSSANCVFFSNHVQLKAEAAHTWLTGKTQMDGTICTSNMSNIFIAYYVQQLLKMCAALSGFKFWQP